MLPSYIQATLWSLGVVSEQHLIFALLLSVKLIIAASGALGERYPGSPGTEKGVLCLFEILQRKGGLSPSDLTKYRNKAWMWSSRGNQASRRN